MTPARILVVEDDPSIGQGLAQALKGEGYEVDWAETACAALSAAESSAPDLVLLDLGLPDADGVDTCRQLRAHNLSATIVMLTARRQEIDVVVGLDAGADDYITKPFRLAELMARIRAHLRRQPMDAANGDDQLEIFQVGDLKLDTGAHRAWIDDRELELRPKEFDLLALLSCEAGRAVTRERIMSEVWDENWYGSTKTLDMHVSALRKRFGETGDGDEASRITTLRGVGYRLEIP